MQTRNTHETDEIQLRQRVVGRLRLGYLFAVVSCLLFLTLYPVWHGQRYLTKADDPLRPFSPSFLLMGGAEHERHPVWDPPRPLASEIQATVRWPWNPPTHRYHIEIDIGAFVFGVFASLLVLGILLLAAYKIFAPGAYDWFFLLTFILTSLLLLVLIAFLFLTTMLSGGWG